MCLGLTGEKQTLSGAWAHYIWTQRYMLLYVVVGIGLAFFCFSHVAWLRVCTLQASNNKSSNSSAYSTQLCYLNVCAEYYYSKYAEYIQCIEWKTKQMTHTHTCKPHNRVLINCFALVLLDAIARDVSISELQSLCAIFLLSFRCFVFTLYKTDSKQQRLNCTTINDKLRKLYNNHWNFCKEKIIIIIENAKYTHVEQI